MGAGWARQGARASAARAAFTRRALLAPQPTATSRAGRVQMRRGQRRLRQAGHLPWRAAARAARGAATRRGARGPAATAPPPARATRERPPGSSPPAQVGVRCMPGDMRAGNAAAGTYASPSRAPARHDGGHAAAGHSAQAPSSGLPGAGAAARTLAPPHLALLQCRDLQQALAAVQVQQEPAGLRGRGQGGGLGGWAELGTALRWLAGSSSLATCAAPRAVPATRLARWDAQAFQHRLQLRAAHGMRDPQARRQLRGRCGLGQGERGRRGRRRWRAGPQALLADSQATAGRRPLQQQAPRSSSRPGQQALTAGKGGALPGAFQPCMAAGRARCSWPAPPRGHSRCPCQREGCRTPGCGGSAAAPRPPPDW